MDLNATLKALDLIHVFCSCWEGARILPPMLYGKVHVLEFWVIALSQF